MPSLFDATLETKSGGTFAAKELVGSTVALYFSAHWCPPCRAFTPKLAAAYEMAKEEGKNFEVIFVSSDDDTAAQAKYMDEMHGDWLRVPFDSPLRNQLKQRYGCFGAKEQPQWPGVARRSGIPALVVVGSGGEELLFDARAELEQAGVPEGWSKYAWARGTKRRAAEGDGDDEATAEAEIAAAIAAAKLAPPDEEISGLGSGTAMLHFDVPASPAPQYLPGAKPGGLGETQRLMLAEAGAAYTHLVSPMGEEQEVSCEWRKRSPNGLTPLLSGLGVPRSAPLSQSSSTIRFLARRYGMAGKTELDEMRADCLFETAKDLKGKSAEIIGSADGETAGAKGPKATAARIAAMLEQMPDAADEAAALNYAQMELLHALQGCEEEAAGCVARLSPALEAFRAAAAARPRLARYLASPMRMPAIVPGYKYAKGAVKRSAFAM